MASATMPDLLISTLADYLKIKIPELTIRQDWPYTSEKLTFPSLTITDSKPVRTPMMPEEYSRTQPDMNNKIVVTEVVADWDSSLQLDLWTVNKLERKKYTAAIVDAFCAQELDLSGDNKADGLSLPVGDNFGDTARFEIVDSQTIDDEAGAQRQERREKITVIANCREIRQRTYYAIRIIQSAVGTPDNSEAVTDDTTGTDISTLPSS